MIPAMPAYVALPSQYRDAYHVAPVVAAIPLGSGSFYAVTAVNPSSPPGAPTYVAAEVTRNAHGSWFADETFPAETLTSALGNMVSLAGEVHHWLLEAP